MLRTFHYKQCSN